VPEDPQIVGALGAALIAQQAAAEQGREFAGRQTKPIEAGART
jgi:hypothetical protein